ncbi:hypothetical protein KAH43_03765 [Candidatus Bipolaricaulota bacterium]|nr:hypothetical protein [Candidatus Bipolaricaulota bacterium]
MPFDFSRFLLEIERRSRRFRGLSLACRLLFYGSLTSIAAILVLRWLLAEHDQGYLFFVLLIPVVLASGAFVLGWWKHPHLPHLLMKLDDELKSGARISSLYEARLRGHDSFFRHRLERLVETLAADWKHGIRLPRHTFGFLSAGLLGILIAGVFLLVPLPFPQAASMLPPQQSESSATQAPRSTAADTTPSTRPDDGAVTLETPEQVPDSLAEPTSEELAQLAPNEALSLESVLDDLGNLSRGQAQVDKPTTSDELLDLAEGQEQAKQALSDMLQDLHEQMEGSPRSLTQQESKGLQELASQTGDSEIKQKTDEITDETDPDALSEKIQDLMDEMDPNSDTPESAPETNDDAEDGSRQDSPQSTEISGDEEAGQKFLEQTAERMQEQANAESQQEGQSQQPANLLDDEDSQDPGQDGNAEARMAGEPDDLAQVGGEDGLGGNPGDGPDPGTVGFIQEDAPSSIGDEGEFVNEFVTKGVPIEMTTSADGTTTRLVDFERMDSILQGRNLPDEAQASIRRYFELITQPEGGS